MVKKLVKKSEFAQMAGVSGAAVTKASKGQLNAALVGKMIDVDHPAAIAYIEKKAQTPTTPAATGLDPLYEDVLTWIYDNHNFTVSAIMDAFKMGHRRATRIIKTMAAADVLPTPVNAPRRKEKTEPGHFIERTRPPDPTPPPRPPHVRGPAAAKEKKKQAPPPEVENTIDLPADIQELGDFTLNELIDKFGTDTRFVDWLTATQKIEAINEKRLKNAATKGELISRQLVKDHVIDTFNSAHLRLMKDGAKSIAAGVVSKHSAGATGPEIEAYVSDILGSFIKPIKNKIARALKNG